MVHCALGQVSTVIMFANDFWCGVVRTRVLWTIIHDADVRDISEEKEESGV